MDSMPPHQLELNRALQDLSILKREHESLKSLSNALHSQISLFDVKLGDYQTNIDRLAALIDQGTLVHQQNTSATSLYSTNSFTAPKNELLQSVPGNSEQTFMVTRSSMVEVKQEPEPLLVETMAESFLPDFTEPQQSQTSVVDQRYRDEQIEQQDVSDALLVEPFVSSLGNRDRSCETSAVVEQQCSQEPKEQQAVSDSSLLEPFVSLLNNKEQRSAETSNKIRHTRVAKKPPYCIRRPSSPQSVGFEISRSSSSNDKEVNNSIRLKYRRLRTTTVPALTQHLPRQRHSGDPQRSSYSHDEPISNCVRLKPSILHAATTALISTPASRPKPQVAPATTLTPQMPHQQQKLTEPPMTMRHVRRATVTTAPMVLQQPFEQLLMSKFGKPANVRNVVTECSDKPSGRSPD